MLCTEINTNRHQNELLLLMSIGARKLVLSDFKEIVFYIDQLYFLDFFFTMKWYVIHTYSEHCNMTRNTDQEF